MPHSGCTNFLIVSSLDQEFPLPFTRRQLLSATALLALAGSGAYLLPPLTMPAKADDTAAPADLAQAGPQGDIVLGSDKAPVTVIEYASMDCPHCAHFATTTYPELKKRYIDTGKVRYIFREFPLHQIALAGSMLARCAAENDKAAGNEKYMAIVEALFANQANWVVEAPLQPLGALAKQFGFTDQSFKDCLSNQKLEEDILAVRDHAVEKLGINSTPTFFVNGKKLVGDVSIDQMAKEIDPYLKEG
jgi:protein-disulfide isomerase